RAAGQTGPITFRPPYGKKLLLLPLYLAQTGRVSVMWDVEPDSYPEVAADPERIVAHVSERVQPGSIILLHIWPESRAASREAIPSLVSALKEQGYTFVTVSELLTLRR
ncbi:MAG: polysaccharide deacetylase family protein, partial [Chloroflexota bacterium]